MGSYGANAAKIFDIQKSYAGKLLKNLPYATDNINAGVILTGDNAVVKHQLGEVKTLEPILKAIKNLKNPNSEPDIKQAFKLSSTTLFTERHTEDSYGARRDASKVLVLFLHHNFNDDFVEEITTLRSANIQIFVVVIGESVDGNNVLSLVENNDHIVYLKDGKIDKDDIETLINNVQEGILLLLFYFYQ